ncbi:signal peptidase I [Iodidimonas sp. SYSU 1G8]|uniref:signal peptidase I n=1 Tax=Iodidimonas sp. SYSU 1G8 TaxID=3133967 RepID=UPI0031FF2E7D
MSEPLSPSAATPKPAKEEKKQGAFSEFISTIVVAVLIALTFRTVAYEPFNIPSGSMYPTLWVGDYLLVSKFSYGYSQHSLPMSIIPFKGRVLEQPVERGDVAVFKWPADNKTDYIKRIIGLPGDTLQTIDGALYINGKAVERRQIEDFVMEGTGQRFRQMRETLPNGVSYNTLDCEYYEGSSDCIPSQGDNRGPFTVPAEHYFAMGDNRDNSTDSRFPVTSGFGGMQTGVGFVPAENLVGRADILFFSTCGSMCDAPLFKPWNWFSAMRYSRFFNIIE